MWADNNVYATQNGGKYKFLVEPDVKLAIPDDQSLWDDLMSNKTEHGIPLSVYEQDWMYLCCGQCHSISTIAASIEQLD